MSVTLTDEKHAELVRMLDTIVRGCDARAYDIGLSLDPLRELLGDVAALTREPAPAASSEFELSAFGKALVAGGTLEDAFAAEGVRLDAAPAPAPCPHRELELEREALKATLEAALRWTRGSRTGWSRSYLTAQLEARIAALASAQPCAAPGEAGEWSEAGLVTHKFKAHYDVAGSCTEPLSNIAQDGDYIRVYEPRYRRRAPERAPGSEPWCPACEMRCREFGGRSGCCDKPVEWRAPEREGGDPDVR